MSEWKNRKEGGRDGWTDSKGGKNKWKDKWMNGGREGGREGRGRIGNTSCSDVMCAADSYQGPGGVY